MTTRKKKTKLVAVDPVVIAHHRDELLSLRDTFALAALQGDSVNRSPSDAATRCYLVADAMLKERAKGMLVAHVDDGDGFKRAPEMDRPFPPHDEPAF